MMLIVDDDPTFLEYARAAFERSNSVCFASDATHAISLMEYLGSRVAVALVDLDLPGTSGYELIRAFRERDPELPIVAISAVVSDAALQSATVFGAKVALRKPITADWRVAIDRIRRSGECRVPPDSGRISATGESGPGRPAD